MDFPRSFSEVIAREGLMNKILYADDLVFMSESMENLKESF